MIGKATLVFLKIRKFKAFLFDYTGTCLLAVGCVFGIFFFRLLHSFGDRGLRDLGMFITGQMDDVALPIELVKSIRSTLILYVGLSFGVACLVKNKQWIFFILYLGWLFFGCAHVVNFAVNFTPFAAFLSAFVISIFLRKKRRFLLRVNTLIGVTVHVSCFLVLVALFAAFFFCRETDIFILPW